MGALSRFGPGILVTAAFIGPGTIATASSAGANFGFALVWTLAFSIFATIVLQEMAARLGLVTRAGPSVAMRRTLRSPALRVLGLGLIVAAIGFGNAAYQAGNITGAALALQSVWGGDLALWASSIGLFALALLAGGHYRLLERILIGLVLLMSAVFLLTALMVAPAPGDILAGLLRPSLPPGSGLTAVALIGTTVVPYNLFLHANAVCEKWPADVPLQRAMRESRLDTGLSVGLGGLITLAVMSTAAAAFFGTATTLQADSMAQQLEPLLGRGARYIFALGLFASGLTSAITAPLAAAYAVCGAAGWRPDLRAPGCRLVWFAVLATGTAFAAAGTRPLAAILFAQAANGFLLPIIAAFLLLLMNRADLLGDYRNGRLANLLGALVVVTAAALGASKLAAVAGWL